MTIRALYTAATGMEAHQFNLDTIANNLANASTTAFKRSRADFEDLFYQQYKLPGVQDPGGNPTPIGLAVGIGARINGTQVNFNQGNVLQTGNSLDLAITGEGFFQVQDPQSGQIVYSRAGNFTVNANGQVVLASADIGRPIEPTIQIPQGATQITISGDGTVAVLEPPNQTPTTVGTIQTAKFINPQGLVQLGQNLYSAGEGSGPAQVGNPGIEGRGQIKQGFLESSNVEPVNELVDLIKTQRNFELNSQVVQAADQTLQLIANLRRY